jgi:hypothetical protein
VPSQEANHPSPKPTETCTPNAAVFFRKSPASHQKNQLFGDRTSCWILCFRFHFRPHRASFQRLPHSVSRRILLGFPSTGNRAA